MWIYLSLGNNGKIEFDELLVCLKVLHRRPLTYQVEEVAIAPEITCNLSNHTVSVAGKSTLLTPTEFAILEYLIRHRGTPVPQHELSEHVFDFAKEHWSNTIEVHVKNLRKKLQIHDYENPIKTIRGVGYTLQV